MPTKGWGKDTDVLNAVKVCMIRGLPTEESLVFLESKGFKITPLKLRKIKRYLRESIDERLDYIARHDYVESYVTAIDILNSIKTRSLEIMEENKDSPNEQWAIEQIPKIIILLEK